MSRSAHRWLIVVGALLLVLPPVLWQQTRAATDVGTPPGSMPTESATSPDRPSASKPNVDRDEPSAPAAVPPSPSSEAAADDAGRKKLPVEARANPGTRPAPPVWISLPALGVSAAPVDPVGLDPDGAVDLPDDVRRVGWYRQGPRPGEAGNAFFTSHVDSRTQGPGVLFDLSRSQPGDPVLVTHADGTTSTWQIVARERIVKGSYPMQRVFRFDGEPGLVIDTCGGRFDPDTGSYENIDIVYAVPAT